MTADVRPWTIAEDLRNMKVSLISIFSTRSCSSLWAQRSGFTWSLIKKASIRTSPETEWLNCSSVKSPNGALQLPAPTRARFFCLSLSLYRRIQRVISAGIPGGINLPLWHHIGDAFIFSCVLVPRKKTCDPHFEESWWTRKKLALSQRSGSWLEP